MSDRLPKGWVETPIKKISHIVYGKGLPQKKLIIYSIRLMEKNYSRIKKRILTSASQEFYESLIY
jgi:hypothetical protein